MIEEEYPLEYVQELDRLLNLESSEMVVAEEVQPAVSSTNNVSGEAISSNLQYVEQKMQQLLGRVNNCVSYCDDRHGVTTENANNKLYDNMNKLTNKYYKTSRKLMNKVEKEIAFVIAAAKEYDRLDKELKRKAGEL